MNQELKAQIEAVVEPYLNSQTQWLDCDGMSRVIATLLAKQLPQVTFVPMCGQLTNTVTGQCVGWHAWLDLGEGWLIDYKARLWLANANSDAACLISIPNGVFRLDDYPDFSYVGEDWRHFTNIITLSDVLFTVLTDAPDAQIMHRLTQQLFQGNHR